MCGGSKKSSAPAPAPAPVVDPSSAARSQQAQMEAQQRANAATIISSTDSQLPQSFGSELSK